MADCGKIFNRKWRKVHIIGIVNTWSQTFSLTKLAKVHWVRLWSCFSPFLQFATPFLQFATPFLQFATSICTAFSNEFLCDSHFLFVLLPSSSLPLPSSNLPLPSSNLPLPFALHFQLDSSWFTFHIYSTPTNACIFLCSDMSLVKLMVLRIFTECFQALQYLGRTSNRSQGYHQV